MAGAIRILAFEANALFRALDLPSRMTANRLLWATGLALQCALVLEAFRRGVARKFPFFAGLILFYPLRAAMLFALAGRMDSGAYDSLFNALALLEFPLQALVAGELALRLLRDGGGWVRRRVVVLLLLFAASCGLAWLALGALPERQLADRVQVLMGLAMLALFAAALRSSRSRNLTFILGGFATFAAIQLAALAGKAHAITRHDAGAYVGWSYAPACGYLVVVVFWLVLLKRETRTTEAG
ncbi:MAG: hypothetical protein WBE72_09505 [Terracidiphilus sp.]